jgi:hypothetical protein
MRLEKIVLSIGMIAFLFVFTNCETNEFAMDELSSELEASAKGKPDKTGDATVGNNLSFPVIWSDGVAKDLRGDMETVRTEGIWWYVWGTDPIDPQGTIYSCGPYLIDEYVGGDEGDPCEPEELTGAEYIAYIQKDAANEWQASNWVAGIPVDVSSIDWGDSLESINWSINSQVRLEVTLYKLLGDYNDPKKPDPVIQYAMRHCDSWGIDEVHGLQTHLDGTLVTNMDEGFQDLGTVATIYTPNARLTIQKLYVDDLGNIGNELTWDPNTKKWIGEVINQTPLLTNAVYEAEDGPGSFSAEVNVKGKIMYGYTWNVRKLNEDPGYYRITFSLDQKEGLNTNFNEDTAIIIPDEEGEEEKTILASESDPKGGHAVLDTDNNLTYMDILIVGKTTGGGGSGGQGGGSGGGSGTGGGNHN